MKRSIDFRGVGAKVLVVGALALVLGWALAVQAQIVIQGDAGFVAKVEECLEKIAASGGQCAAALSQVTGSGNIHTIKEGNKSNGSTPNNESDATDGSTGTGSTTTWDPDYTDNYTDDVARDPCASLCHEIMHMADFDKGKSDPSAGHNGIPKEEIKACGGENEYREKNGLPKRTKYGGQPLP